MFKRILVTGGAGFIGSNFLNGMVKQYPECMFINYDALTYAGNLENLIGIEASPNYRFVKGDITDRDTVNQIVGEGVEAIVHFAAESHVDRSILEPDVFVRTNVLGTLILLDAAKQHHVQKYVQVSTDEVYGSLGPMGLFTEDTPLTPNSPYSASKAAADLLVRAYHLTYGLPVNITRCSNNYGPYQFPEKLIPLFVTNALEDQPLPLYGDGLNIRDWIHVSDHCRAIDRVLRFGKPGEVYNIGGNSEMTNLAITQLVLQELRKPETLIRHIQDRPGHDRRYAIDATKIHHELGWQPQYSFAQGIRETIQWYQDHRDWWERVKQGDYRLYYDRMYAQRLQEKGPNHLG